MQSFTSGIEPAGLGVSRGGKAVKFILLAVVAASLVASVWLLPIKQYLFHFT